MELNRLRLRLAAALVALVWIAAPGVQAQLSNTLLYDFGSDYEGWVLQFAQRYYNQSGQQAVLDYLPFTPEGWDDATHYPLAPGDDAAGNGEGAFAVGLRLEGVWDNVNPEHRWFDAAYVQSEDWYTHNQTGWPAGYEHHADYAGSWAYGHYGSLGAVSGDYLRLRLYNPGFTHADDPVQGWFYTKSGSGWTWVDGGPVNLEHGWNVLRFPVSAIADANDLREFGVKLGASHPVWGEMYVDGVTLGETSLDGRRLVYLTPDVAWFSEEPNYDSRVVRAYYDDGGQISPGVRGVHLELHYPPECVRVTGITQGTFLSGYSNHFESTYDNGTGEAVIDWVILGTTTGASGFGSLAAITFEAAVGHEGDDCCDLLDLDDLECKLRDPDNLTLTATYVDGLISHDITPPDDPLLASSTHAEGGSSSATNIAVSWASTSDHGTCPAGNRGYYLLLDDDPDGEPDPATATFSWFTPWVPDSVSYQHWFEGVADGTWYVHVIGYDYVWNSTAVDTYGPIHIDTGAPDNVTGFDADITDDADLSTDLAWTNPGGDFAGVKIFRKGFGNYPEYDDPPDAGSVPVWPTSPADALANGWTEVYDGTGTSHIDNPAVRDYYYYAAFAYDLASNYAAAGAGARDESLCYWLGDFVGGSPIVGVLDVLALSLSYNTEEGDPTYDSFFDIGPTTDFGRKSRPTTDNEIEFEDLIVLAMNYETTRGVPAREVDCSGLMSASVALSQEGEDLVARIRLHENPGCLLGASVKLEYDRSLTLIGASAGDLWPEGGSFFHASPLGAGSLGLDAAALGSTIGGDGCHAVVRFHGALAGGQAPILRISEFRARGTGNVELAGGASPQEATPGELRPSTHALLSSGPNPAREGARIRFQLASEERVSVLVFDAAGRCVRTLAEGALPAGPHDLVWDGRRADGTPAEPGVYFCRLQAGSYAAVSRLLLVR